MTDRSMAGREHQFTVRMDGSITDYHVAPGGEGPHGATWKDKPHRLLYDTLGEVQHLRSELAAQSLRLIGLTQLASARAQEIADLEHQAEVQESRLLKLKQAVQVDCTCRSIDRCERCEAMCDAIDALLTPPRNTTEPLAKL